MGHGLVCYIAIKCFSFSFQSVSLELCCSFEAFRQSDAVTCLLNSFFHMVLFLWIQLD